MLDREALRRQRPVTRALAGEILGEIWAGAQATVDGLAPRTYAP